MCGFLFVVYVLCVVCCVLFDGCNLLVYVVTCWLLLGVCCLSFGVALSRLPLVVS